MDYGTFHSNTQLYCVAISLLTYSQRAPPNDRLVLACFLEIVGVKGHVIEWKRTKEARTV